MKNYMVIALCLTIMASVLMAGRKVDQPCKLVQRYYRQGKLVATEEFTNIVKDHGCLASYLINGIEVKADSVVTTLK